MLVLLQAKADGVDVEQLELHEERMLWASGVRGHKGRVRDAMQRRYMRVVTVESVPFVFKTLMPPSSKRPNSSASSSCSGVPCSHRNNRTGARTRCSSAQLSALRSVSFHSEQS